LVIPVQPSLVVVGRDEVGDGPEEGPDQLWVADITYVPTWSGFLYLAAVVWSRRVVG
jgi:transposase InsO family protein